VTESLRRELEAAREAASLLRREVQQREKRTAEVSASLATLKASLVIAHGKRIDRRLARAQRIAERSLKKAKV
jgi:hypothetical protein